LNNKAVALLSGGLDSTLALKVVLEQGVEVIALNFTSQFCTCNHRKGVCSEAARVAREMGVEIKTLVKGLDYLDVIRNPSYGYGQGINPCVDCRIYMLKRAKRFMEEVGASFMITGEVLGQRPMSQRRDSMRSIDRDTGLEGLILRPLCAKHLQPTLPEKEGIIDREKLLDFVGRSRKPQMALAEEMEINDYPCPSGGCLLTDKIFSRKVRDLLDHKSDPTNKDLSLLKVGRHFRFNGSKIVLGREEGENQKIINLRDSGDAIINTHGFPGPTALIRGAVNDETILIAGRLLLRYSKNKANGNSFVVCTKDGTSSLVKADKPIDEETLDTLRI
jgi:tRNA-specific 2-thiouridylase